jgi:hypothetical protein
MSLLHFGIVLYVLHPKQSFTAIVERVRLGRLDNIMRILKKILTNL